MKVIILKKYLINGLNIVERVTGKNLTLPILNNILISTEKNFLSLAATDLELGIKYWVLAKIEKEGKSTLPAKLLSGFIKLLPEEKISFEARGQTVHLSCKDYKTQIKTLDPEEFPIIPKIESKDSIELNSSLLCEGLSQVVDFCSPTQTRPELSGIYLNFQKDRVQLTATDSFRLAEKTLFLEKKIDKEYSLILPQKTIRELINIFSEMGDKVKLYFAPNQVLFEYPMPETQHPQIQIISRLIEGEYPDYQEIIPKKYEARIVLSKDEFLNQIKAASLFSGKTNEVKVKMKKGGLEIFSQSPELGENKSFLTGKIDHGQAEAKEMEVVFNHRFLADGLMNIKTKKVIFELNKNEGPAVLRPEGDSSYLYVVMPINLA